MSIQQSNPSRKPSIGDMNRIELGKKLADIRDGKNIKSDKLSAYVIQSIEAGKSSYSVTSLFLYTDALNCSVFVWDYNIDEHYRVGSVDDCHELIEQLLHNNGMELKDLNPRIGIRYTKPKDGQALLSIDTLLAILSYFHCSIKLSDRHKWLE